MAFNWKQNRKIKKSKCTLYKSYKSWIEVPAKKRNTAGYYSCQDNPTSTPVTPAPSCACGLPNNKRIGGGYETEPHEFPWNVRLRIQGPDGNGLCSGSLITNNHVITAAHCFDDMPTVEADKIFVQIGKDC